MRDCPYCGHFGADILLNMVFCSNKDCQWFDEVHANRLDIEVDQMLNHYLSDQDNKDDEETDPDITPFWYPKI